MTSPFRKSPLSKRKTSTPARTTKHQLQFVSTVSLESDNLEPIPFESDDEISTTDTKTSASVIPDNESSTVSDSVETNSASETLHVHQDASDIANLMDCGDSPAEHDITRQIVRFIELVKLKKFPLDIVALRLFLDTVNWFDQSDVRSMRYSTTTLIFFWLGKKLFGGRFIRFMSGLKNETDFLNGKEATHHTEIKLLSSALDKFKTVSETVTNTANI